MIWALVIDGKVHELTYADPVGRYHPDLVWVDCSATHGVEVGWTYDGAVFAPPPP